MLNHLIQNGNLQNFEHDYSATGGVDKESLNNFPVGEFKNSETLSEEHKRCAVCMCDYEENEKVKFLHCLHRFHVECIDKWLEKNSTCPICKKDQN